MKTVSSIKDFMIEQYVNGMAIGDDDWIEYYESLVEEAERRQDDYCGE